MRLVIGLSLLLSPSLAFAMPAAFAAVAAFVKAYSVYIAIAQVVLSVGSMAYSAKQKRKQERAARAAYNAGLQDRLATSIAADAPYRYVIGECLVGANIVAMFTSGSRDELQHVVAVLAHHESESIDDILINGKSLGALNPDGHSLDPAWSSSSPQQFTETHTGPVFTLENDATDAAITVYGGLNMASGDPMYFTGVVSPDRRTVTLPPECTGTYEVSYTGIRVLSYVRVKKHLGTPGEPADATLIAEVPSKWTAEHTLPGQTYIYLRFWLEKPELQDGPPLIQAKMKGMKLYDVRTGVTSYNGNVALAAYWYLTSELCNISPAMLPLAKYQTAANVCAEPVANLGGAARYTFNGTITSDQQQSQVLKQLAQAMAGGIDATTWDIFAGKYVAPIRDFEQEDIIGGISIVGNTSSADIFNGVRGQFSSPENGYVITDFAPYQNSAYRAADGVDLYTDLDFPFTDTAQRVHNLCRIITERNRNGMTVTAEMSAKSWDLAIGDRITLTSAFWGWVDKVFIVENIKRKQGAAVELVLQEDAPEIWDEADAVTVDAIPNTGLADPFETAPLQNLICDSGDSAFLIMSDGTLVSRIHVRWDAVNAQNVYNTGMIEIEWARIDGTQLAWNKTSVNGAETEAYISPVSDGYYYQVRARAVNSTLNAKSDWAYASAHQVIGKTAPPPDVSGFSIENGALAWPNLSRTVTPDLAGYEIRFQYGKNAAWSNGSPLHEGLLLASPFAPALIPAGAITLMIKAVDTSGNVSNNAAVIYHNFGDPIVENLILSYDDKAAGFPGEKLNCAVVGGDLLADDSGDLFWSSDSAPFWGYDIAPFWPASTYLDATYITRYTVQQDEAGSRLTLTLSVDAASYTVEYRYDTQGDFFGIDANHFWQADSTAFWAPPTAWSTWPGAIDAIKTGVIEFRIVMQGGVARGAVSQFALQFDVEDELEELSDVAISDLGTRLPIQKNYRSIKNIQLTLQDDGGAAATAKWHDKLADGPLIYCFNDAGVKVSGTIDARIQGVKG